MITQKVRETVPTTNLASKRKKPVKWVVGGALILIVAVTWLIVGTGMSIFPKPEPRPIDQFVTYGLKCDRYDPGNGEPVKLYCVDGTAYTAVQIGSPAPLP
jgi:hypothetical protein